MPKVSVLMGAYNCADTVGKSIESISSQTFIGLYWQNQQWTVAPHTSATISDRKISKSVENKGFSGCLVYETYTGDESGTRTEYMAFSLGSGKIV